MPVAYTRKQSQQKRSQFQALLRQISPLCHKSSGNHQLHINSEVIKALMHCLHLLTAKACIPKPKQEVKTQIVASCPLSWDPNGYETRVKLLISIKLCSPQVEKGKETSSNRILSWSLLQECTHGAPWPVRNHILNKTNSFGGV